MNQVTVTAAPVKILVHLPNLHINQPSLLKLQRGTSA